MPGVALDICDCQLLSKLDCDQPPSRIDDKLGRPAQRVRSKMAVKSAPTLHILVVQGCTASEFCQVISWRYRQVGPKLHPGTTQRPDLRSAHPANLFPLSGV